MYCKKCNSLLNENNLCPICDSNTAPQETNELSQAIEALKNGNQEAFNVFYSYTNKYVYSRAKTLSHDEQTANDVMQEVYISAYKNINSLKSNESVFAWLRTITFNASNRIMKKNKIETVLSEENEEMLESLPDENEQIEEDYMNKQDIEIIRDCIDRLSNEHRTVLLAYYYDNLKVEEIAELLQISSGTVKSRLYTARKKLKEYIEEEEKKNGYKLHSFSGLSLALALRKLLQENMNSTAINAEAFCRSVCEKINSPVNNSAITSAAKPKNKLIKGVGRTSKSKMVQKIAEIGIKKVVLSAVTAVAAAGVVSGTIVAVVTFNSKIDSTANYTSVESVAEELVSSEIITNENLQSEVSSDSSIESTNDSSQLQNTNSSDASATENETATEPEIMTLQLNVATSYHGYPVYFCLSSEISGTDSYQLEALGMGNNEIACSGPSEYTDINTGETVCWVGDQDAVGGIVGAKDIMYGYVYPAGAGKTLVNAVGVINEPEHFDQPLNKYIVFNVKDIEQDLELKEQKTTTTHKIVFYSTKYNNETLQNITKDLQTVFYKSFGYYATSTVENTPVDTFHIDNTEKHYSVHKYYLEVSTTLTEEYFPPSDDPYQDGHTLESLQHAWLADNNGDKIPDSDEYMDGGDVYNSNKNLIFSFDKWNHFIYWQTTQR